MSAHYLTIALILAATTFHVANAWSPVDYAEGYFEAVRNLSNSSYSYPSSFLATEQRALTCEYLFPKRDLASKLTNQSSEAHTFQISTKIISNSSNASQQNVITRDSVVHVRIEALSADNTISAIIIQARNAKYLTQNRQNNSYHGFFGKFDQVVSSEIANVNFNLSKPGSSSIISLRCIDNWISGKPSPGDTAIYAVYGDPSGYSMPRSSITLQWRPGSTWPLQSMENNLFWGNNLYSIYFVATVLSFKTMTMSDPPQVISGSLAYQVKSNIVFVSAASEDGPKNFLLSLGLPCVVGLMRIFWSHIRMD